VIVRLTIGMRLAIILRSLFPSKVVAVQA
jgi:hypothetical protein